MIKYQVRSAHQTPKEIEASAPKIAASRFVNSFREGTITENVEVVAIKNIHVFKTKEL